MGVVDNIFNEEIIHKKKIKNFNFQCNKCTNFYQILPLLVFKECLCNIR